MTYVAQLNWKSHNLDGKPVDGFPGRHVSVVITITDEQCDGGTEILQCTDGFLVTSAQQTLTIHL